MVHEVGDSWDRLGRHLEAVDQARFAPCRREERRRLLVVDVECEADRDAPLLCLDDLVCDDLRGRLLEVEVVQREVEAPLGCLEESGEPLGDLERGLAAVGEGVRLDHEAGP